MPDEYSTAAFSAEHRPAIASLWGRVFHRSPSVAARYLAWKYEENPYIRDPLIALAFSGNELVAMRGLVGTSWTDRRGNRTIIPAAEDLAVHKDHRGRGLFLPINKKLIQLAKDSGFGTVLSLSAARQTRQLQSLTGWQHLASRKIIRPLEHRRFDRLRNTSRELAIRLVQRPPSDRRLSHLLDGLESTKLKVSDPQNAESLCAMVAFRGLHGHERSLDFYRWRLANPDRRYRIISIGDDELVAFAILGWRPSRPKQPSIVDSGATEPHHLSRLLEILNENSDVLYDILPSALPPSVLEDLGRLGWTSDGSNAAGTVEVFTRAVTRNMKAPELGRIDLIDTMRF